MTSGGTPSTPLTNGLCSSSPKRTCPSLQSETESQLVGEKTRTNMTSGGTPSTPLTNGIWAYSIVTLNVGGTIYTTSIETLTRYPDSMLGKMFKTLDGNENGGENHLVPSTKDEHGRFVIDRDGPLFRYVLNFLRESSLTLPKDFKDLDLLKREAEFYQIQPLIEAVDTMDQKTDCIWVDIHQDKSQSYWEVIGKKEVLDKLSPILQKSFDSCLTLLSTIKEFDGFGLSRLQLEYKTESIPRLLTVATLNKALTDEGFRFIYAQTIEKGPTVQKDRMTEGWLMFQR